MLANWFWDPLIGEIPEPILPIERLPGRLRVDGTTPNATHHPIDKTRELHEHACLHDR